MSPQIVIDSSAMVAFLTDSSGDGTWVTAHVEASELAAPALMPFETINVLRRQEAAGLLSADAATQAGAEFGLLAVELWPYSATAPRAWELRHNLTIFDGCYVALAEVTSSTLITLDRRLSRATGIRCEVRCPPVAD